MASVDGWLAAFVSGLDRELTGDLAALRSVLEQQIAPALQEWPGVKLSPDEFAAALARKLDPEVDPVAELARLRVSDLFLAVAAGVDAPGAALAFDQKLLSRVPRFLARTGASPAMIEEATQQLRVKLLVATGDAPARINQYSGHGALDSWVCAAAVRLVRDLQRAEARQRYDDGDQLEVLAASDDPELELLRARYGDEFRAALRATVGELTPRQRTLLKLYYFERLPTIAIGRLYRVNQSTAWRWIGEAREAVLSGVRRRLLDQLGLSGSALDSLLELLQSQLDVSFQRLLAPGDSKSSSS